MNRVVAIVGLSVCMVIMTCVLLVCMPQAVQAENGSPQHDIVIVLDVNPSGSSVSGRLAQLIARTLQLDDFTSNTRLAVIDDFGVLQLMSPQAHWDTEFVKLGLSKALTSNLAQSLNIAYTLLNPKQAAIPCTTLLAGRRCTVLVISNRSLTEIGSSVDRGVDALRGVSVDVLIAYKKDTDQVIQNSGISQTAIFMDIGGYAEGAQQAKDVLRVIWQAMGLQDPFADWLMLESQAVYTQTISGSLPVRWRFVSDLDTSDKTIFAAEGRVITPTRALNHSYVFDPAQAGTWTVRTMVTGAYVFYAPVDAIVSSVQLSITLPLTSTTGEDIHMELVDKSAPDVELNLPERVNGTVVAVGGNPAQIQFVRGINGRMVALVPGMWMTPTGTYTVVVPEFTSGSTNYSGGSAHLVIVAPRQENAIGNRANFGELLIYGMDPIKLSWLLFLALVLILMFVVGVRRLRRFFRKSITHPDERTVVPPTQERLEHIQTLITDKKDELFLPFIKKDEGLMSLTYRGTDIEKHIRVLSQLNELFRIANFTPSVLKPLLSLELKIMVEQLWLRCISGQRQHEPLTKVIDLLYEYPVVFEEISTNNSLFREKCVFNCMEQAQRSGGILEGFITECEAVQKIWRSFWDIIDAGNLNSTNEPDLDKIKKALQDLSRQVESNTNYRHYFDRWSDVLFHSDTHLHTYSLTELSTWIKTISVASFWKETSDLIDEILVQPSVETIENKRRQFLTRVTDYPNVEVVLLKGLEWKLKQERGKISNS